MDQIEESIICLFLRDMHKPSYKDLPAVADALIKIEGSILKDDAIAFLYLRPVKDRVKKSIIADAALKLIKMHFRTAIDRYGNPATREYLKKILHLSELPVTVDRGNNLDTIVEQWKRLGLSGNNVFHGGAYQVIRRYKPPFTSPGKTNATYDWDDALNHAVICDVVFLDPAHMQCIKITSEHGVHDKTSTIYKYSGSLTLNHEKILYGIISRELLSKDQVNFQLMAIKIELSEIYSGILLKGGDTTSRPVASECLFVKIPDTHTDIYRELQALYSNAAELDEKAKAIFRNYITDTPPITHYDPNSPSPEWKNVKFVKDFPVLHELVEQSNFREPSRALRNEILLELLSKKLPIFQLNA